MEANAATPTKIQAKILAGQMQTQEIGRNVWVVRPGEDVNPNDIDKPAFWAHVARNLRVNDRIEILAYDASWYAELIVRARTDLEASVGMLSFTKFEQPEASSAEEFTVKYNPGPKNWRVISAESKAVVKEGFETKEAALAWIALPIDQRLAA